MQQQQHGRPSREELHSAAGMTNAALQERTSPRGSRGPLARPYRQLSRRAIP